MEVAEVARAPLHFVQIAERDVQTHGAIAQRSGIELSRRDFEARIEADGTLDDVAFAARLGRGGLFLRARENPALISPPRLRIFARLALEQPAGPDAAL